MKWFFASFIALIIVDVKAAPTPLPYDDGILNPPRADKLSIPEIKAKPKLLLRDETIKQDVDKNLGIKESAYYTGLDKHRFHASYNVSTNYSNPTQLKAVEAGYAYRLDRYDNLWIGGFISSIESNFATVADNKDNASSTTHPDSEAKLIRPDDSATEIITMGVGMGYRFKFFWHWLPTDNVFETTDVYITRNKFSEIFREEDFVGYGLKADYGVHYRLSKHFFYGVKFAYNFSVVERPQISDEGLSDRRLMLSWTSMGFELGYFF